MPAYHLLHDRLSMRRLSMRTRTIFSRVRVRLGLVVVALMFTAMITGVCLPAPAPLYAQGGALYVKADATGGNNGSSWTDAYTDLQEALDAAHSGNEIWVAAGIYKPVAPADPDDVSTVDRQISFELRNSVAVYGGFAGDETERSARDWETNITILSGDISNNDTTDNGVITDPDNIQFFNSYHVVTGNAVDATAILDGFTITGGYADPSAPHAHGGGVFVDGGSPTLRNLLVRGNYAYNDGGGIYSINSSPTLTNVILRDNQALYGGGLAGSGGTPTLSQIMAFDNEAGYGGGLYFNESAPQMTNSVIRDNSAQTDGGGIYNYRSNAALTNVVLSGNGAGSGGGIYNDGSEPALTNVVLSGNDAGTGGGIYSRQSDAALVNVTLSGNDAGNGGGGIYNIESNPTVRNSILWNNRSDGNTNTDEASVYNDFGSTTVFSSSLVENCNPGGNWESDCGSDDGGNLADSDPLFVQSVNPANAPTSDGNLRLQLTSPAIDVGNNTSIPSGVETEIDGKARILNGVVDLGAYEQFIECPQSGRVYVDIDAGGNNDGTSWANAFNGLQTPLVELAAPCQIWVAEGIYKPTTNAADRSATFALRNGIAVYGGFAGTESSHAERDVSANPTILSGDIDSDNPLTSDLSSGGITFNHQSIIGANSYHIVTANNVDNTAILNGFTITGGQANSADPADRGAGIYIVDASPTLSNLNIRGNFAGELGGGIYNSGSGPGSGATLADSTIGGSYANFKGGGLYTEAPITLERTTISGNQAGVWGGGIHAEATAYIIEDGAISSNTAQSGGGIYNFNSNPTFDFVTIAGNTASEHGGGIYNVNSNPTIRYAEIYSNTADYGGGVRNSGVTADAQFLSVRIQGNEAQIHGGGMDNYQSSPTLASVLIAGNTAGEYGGGMDNFESSPTLINVTLASNRAGEGGGGLASFDSNPTLQNTLIWNNRANGVTGSANASMDLEGSSLTITHSLIQARNPSGTGNLDGTSAANDPLFTDAPDPVNAPTVNGNFAQQAGSPIIDAGDSSLVPPANEFDVGLMVGRVAGPAVDLGAYEVNEYILALTIDGNGTVDLDPQQPSYPFNTSVIVTANPAPGWRFADWDNNLDGDVPTQLLIMNGNKVITAIFANNPPTADAGSDQFINVNSSVTLDGSGSSDADPSQTLTYAWTQTGGPNVSLSSATAQQPTFTTPGSPTGLTFELVVTDNLGSASPADSVTIHVSDAPIAGLTAGNDGPTLVGESTQFNTTTSSGSNVVYTWDFDDGNTGSGPNPTHTYAAVGTYTAVVTASNGTNLDTETTVVTVSNSAPTANAGPNQTVDGGATVTLNGSGSSDADGHLPLTYAWTQTEGPNVSLSSTSAAQPTFTAPDTTATLTFQLIVTDAQGAASVPDSVIITVNVPDNTAPTANAGPNQTVDGGATVTLNGSGSSDADGHLPLTYAWTQTEGPNVSLSSTSAAQPTFTAPASGATLIFQLVVTDSQLGASSPDSVFITVNDPDNTAPTANAGPNQTVDGGATVTLNGSGSSDADGHLPLTYAWTQTSGPSVSLSSVSAAQPTFTAPDSDTDSDTTLVFQLIVADALGASSAPATVTITVEADPDPDPTPDPTPTPGVTRTQPTTDTVNIALDTQPTAPVEVAVETELSTATTAGSGQENTCTTDPTRGTIAPGDFATGITFQIVLNINSVEAQTCELRFILTSDDPAYNGQSVAPLTLTADGTPVTMHRVYLPRAARE